MKRFVFTKHVLERARDRGVNLKEIEFIIENAKWYKEKHNRFSSIQVLDYNQIWEEAFYKRKEVKVIFTKEDDKIIIITVIVRYFKE